MGNKFRENFFIKQNYIKGFEVVINGRKYFAFSYYRQDGQNVTSFCKHTFVGTAHDIGVDPKNWSCYVGDHDDDQFEFRAPREHRNSFYVSSLEKCLFKF